jgi:hypothetical protein
MPEQDNARNIHVIAHNGRILALPESGRRTPSVPKISARR